MMKKGIIVILFLIINILFGFAEGLPSSRDYVFSIIPYLGGVDVNLGSLYYGPHDTSVEWDQLELGNFRPDKSTGISPNYTDEHMIAVGGVANIEIEHSTSIKSIGLSNVYIPKNGVSLTVQATCNSNFEFVSQSNPIYRRPFEIEIIPRARTTTGREENVYDTTNPYTKDVYRLNAGNNECVIDLSTSSESTNFVDNVSGDYRITMLAADIVLVLPYDYAKDDGGYFVGGLQYGNATYALADLSDYTAVVTLSMTLRINYYYGAPYGELHTYEESRSITIPFTGYYSSNAGHEITAPTDDSISLYVNATNNAANLNLSEQGDWITVANIQFLYNQSDFVGKGSPSGTSPSLILNSNSDVVRIFLSASPHPEIKSSSSFRLVHEHATSVITNTNSLGFVARIRGTGENSGDVSLKTNSNIVEFDGLANIESLAEIAISESEIEEVTDGLDSVITTCHLEAPANVIGDWGYRHFHTFEGDIDIKFDESSMLEAGIYRGYIYVHAVTED